MDFFSNRPDPPDTTDNIDIFAKAVSNRFVVNPVFSPHSLSLPTPRNPPSSLSQISSATFPSVDPDRLASLLNLPGVLCIDIRPHAAYTSARIPNALSLSVPSTLLKRPLFSLERLAQMLPSSAARNRFSHWKKATVIVVYDVDSAGSAAGPLPEGNNILGLLRKFATDSTDGQTFSGQLFWLKGGFQRVWRERRSLVDLTPPEPELEEDDPSSPASSSAPSASSSALRPQNLPMTAFGSSSTTISVPPSGAPFVMPPRKLPPSNLSTSRGNALVLHPFHNKAPTTPALPFNPFFDTIRQNVELSQGVTERIPLRLPNRVRRRLNELPFDWLKEIGRRSDLKSDASGDEADQTTKRDPEPPQSTDLTPSVDPKRGRPITPPDPALVDAGMDALAMQFYRIELAEQRRLMGVMQHHSKESDGNALKTSSNSNSNSESPSSRDSMEDDGDVHMAEPGSKSPESVSSSKSHRKKEKGTKKKATTTMASTTPKEEEKKLQRKHSGSKKHTAPSQPFPYSITAGVEKGAKNRYRHIWPFEHARVRLHQRRSPPSFAASYPHTSPSFGSASTSSLPLASSSSMLNPASSSSSSFTLRLPFSSRPPSGALTGPISSFPLIRSLSASSRGRSPISVGTSTSTKPSTPSRIRNKPTSLGLPPLSISKTGPSVTFGGTSSVETSFTQMQQRAGSGSGGETTESEQEHEDVRVGGEEGDHDDYVNASYVQPLCTRKRYIATQGPLEATFTDFWMLVYQQNVHVIVMLTREIEGSMIKCGPYWKGEVFGPLRLRLVHVEGREDGGRDDAVKKDAGGFFNFSAAQPDPHEKKATDSIIRRVFHLSHTMYPHLPPRQVVQLQYLGWPDMNVPDDPRGVLSLIREVDRAVEEATFLDGEVEFDHSLASARPKLPRSPSDEALDRNTGIAKHALGRKHAPVLLHCSAGVGRTGGFIAIDAVLDGIRREVRKQMEKEKDDMFVEMKTKKTRDVSVLPSPADVPATPMEVDQPSKNRIDVDMADVSFGPFKTIAIPPNHSGDVLHVPVHNGSSNSRSVSNISDLRKSNVGLRTDEQSSTTLLPLSSSAQLLWKQDQSQLMGAADLGTSSSLIKSNSIRNEDLRTPMQVDGDTSKRLKESGQTTTRIWAEDVSDQTGHHGSAKRVEQTIREMHSQLDRAPQLKDSTALGPADDNWSSHADCESTQSPSPQLASSVYDPSSSVGESTSNSGESFGFKSAFKGADKHHHLSKSLPYNGPPLTSSSGTSMSSVQSGSSKSLKTAAIGLPSHPAGLREESRLRTWSAPSGRPAEVSVVASEGGTPPKSSGESDKAAASPSDMEISRPASASNNTWLTGEDRKVQKSPSPFVIGGERDTPPAPVVSSSSRSLSPSGSGSTGSMDRMSAPPSGDDSSSADKSGSNSGPGSAPQSSSVSDLTSGSLASASASASTAASAPRSRAGSAAVQVPYDANLPGSVAKSLSMPIAKPSAVDPVVKKNSDKIPRTVFDYTQPRTLHGDQSPKALGDYEEPLWEVLQDMREQRMSLCQSLRQYVFVHAAVIEGALMVMDEERERAKLGLADSGNTEPEMPSSTTFAIQLHRSSSSSIPTITSTISLSTTGKRVASPTELPKEDKKGGKLLFKKPSLKRKGGGGSSDESLHLETKSEEDLDTKVTLLHPPTTSMS